jgi:hypothetical protein
VNVAEPSAVTDSDADVGPDPDDPMYAVPVDEAPD